MEHLILLSFLWSERRTALGPGRLFSREEIEDSKMAVNREEIEDSKMVVEDAHLADNFEIDNANSTR